MKKQWGMLFLGLLVLVPFTPLTAQLDQADRGDYVRRGDDWYRLENGLEYRVDPDIISVKFAGSIDNWSEFMASAELDGKSSILRGIETVRTNRLGIHDLRVPAGSDVLDIVDAIRATDLVEFAEENTIGYFVATPNDPSYSQQYALHNTGQTGGIADADIDAPEAWDLGDGDASVIVAVLDSGTEITHNDLNDNQWRNLADPVNGVDDDNNGYTDDIDGWDFANNNRFVDGPFSHGSLVAGIVAAETNNGLGIAGAAGGGFNGTGCRYMVCQVGDFGPSGAILDDAILYALDNGASIITMSLTVGSSGAIDAALQAAWNGDCFIDCAAGNGGPSVTYPATNPNVMAVAATDDRDNVASFSNPGPQVEVAAPGVDILSTGLGQGYEISSGTSFSAPYVAGVAGLIRAAGPLLTNAQVRQLLIDTADDVEAPGFDTDTGWGRINAASALANVSTDPPVIDSISPTSGLVTLDTAVTITGEQFFGTPTVTFGGQPATFVTLIDNETISAGCPAGTELETIDVTVETTIGSDTLNNAFTYVARLFTFGTPSIGNSITYSALGVPNGDWGVVVDYVAGNRLKKGIVWRIAFSEFEIVHNSFQTADPALTGSGQGNTQYLIPDDPGLIGRTLHADGVFDGNGPAGGRPLVLAEDRVDVVIQP